MKQNCWEFMKCGREEGGKNVEQFGICPAFPDNGNSCAEVEGTFCDLVLELLKFKYTSCENCKFYHSESYDNQELPFATTEHKKTKIKIKNTC